MVGKRLVNTGGAASAAAFDPLQNFETVTYTGNGGTQKITGYIRKGAAFNGSSSYADLPLDTFFGEKRTCSVSLWFKAGAQSNNGFIFIDYSGNNNIEITLKTNGTISISTYYGTTPSSVGTTSGTYADNNWHHIVVANDIATNTRKTYIDNVEVLSNPLPSGTFSGLSNFFVGLGVLGAPTPISGTYFNGQIDQFRVFNKALSSGEVTTLYGETYASSTKSTTDIFDDGSGVALYELDEDANDTGVSEHYVFIADAGGLLTDVRINTISSEFTYSAPSGYSDFGGALQTSNGYNESLWNITESNKRATKNDSYYHSGLITQNSYSSGKYYLELEFLAADLIFGVTKQSDLTQLYFTEAVENMIRFTSYTTSVFAYSASNTSSDGQALSSNDVIGLAIDYDNKELHYYVNNTLVTTQNLAGNDGTPTNVNFLGMAFQPDLVWIKDRVGTDNHHLFDSIRGTNQRLMSNQTSAENTEIDCLNSFDSNGFSIGANSGVNANGENHVAWGWKAGGAAVSNTDGNITSTVSANQDAGFSIVSYTGTGANGSFGHGLSAAPEMVIIKSRDQSTRNWITHFSSLGAGAYMSLNLTSANATSTARINTTTNTVVNIGTSANVNLNGDRLISYCFHSVDGYQKVGSYEGNGGVNTIYTDSNGDNTGTGAFKPRWVMIKNADDLGNWMIYDTIRDTDGTVGKFLEANTPDIEADASSAYIAPNSTGFTTGNSNSVHLNKIGQTFIYLAIA